MDKIHYVYEWVRSDLNLPYYIGKGAGKRAYENKRNKHTDSVTKYLTDNNIHIDIRIIAKFISHKSALDFEIDHLANWWWLKEHGILTNQSKGGDGPWGYKHGPEQILKMSLASKGRLKSLVTRQRMSQNNAMKKPEIAAKISGEKHWLCGKGYLISGENNPAFGKTGLLSPAYGRTNGEAQREAARKTGLKNKGADNPNYGKVTSAETRAKLSASNVGQRRSEEAKLKMRKPKSPEGRAVIAASNKRRAELKRMLQAKGEG